MVSKITEDTIEKIVIDMESGIKTFTQITKCYNITAYQYYKIMKNYKLQPEIFKQGLKKGQKLGERRTPLVEIVRGTIKLNDSDDKLFLPFNKEEFIEDSKKKVKIKDLMSKYSLSLYQVRELRKHFNLKRR